MYRRFIWPFFWTLNIVLLFLYIDLFKKVELARQWKTGLVVLFALLCVFEIKDNVDYQQAPSRSENPLTEKYTNNFSKLNVNPKDYQCFVTLPFFTVGCDDGDYTLDDDDGTSLSAYQFHLYSKLPMMNTKLARTIKSQNADVLNFLAKDSVSTSLANKMNDKPILIMVNENSIKDSNGAWVPNVNRTMAREYYFNCNNIIQRHNLEPIDSLDGYKFYSLQTNLPISE